MKIGEKMYYVEQYALTQYLLRQESGKIFKSRYKINQYNNYLTHLRYKLEDIFNDIPP